MPSVRKEFSLNAEETGRISSMRVGGAMLLLFLLSLLGRRAPPKISVLLGTFSISGGSLLLALAPNIYIVNLA